MLLLEECVADSGSFESGFFCVSTVLGKILTLDNLRKKQVIMVNRCCMFKRSEELVDHFLHCDVASALWSALFTRFGLSWVMPSSVINLFAAIWKMMLICPFWCLWKEKNNRCFKDLERSLEDIFNFVFHSLHIWTVAFVSLMSLSFIDFLVRFSLSS
jgi:hypothetical protein